MTKALDIESLRGNLWAMEQTVRRPLQVVSMGVDALDRALSWGGLPLARVHQVSGGNRSALGFCAAILAQLPSEKQIMWCVLEGTEDHIPSGPGLAQFGLAPERLILVRVENQTDLIRAMEEGLRCPGLAAVVGQLGPVNHTAGRRLQLAAEAGGVTGILLETPKNTGGPKLGEQELGRPELKTEILLPSAATTNWRVQAAPSPRKNRCACKPLWHVQLERCRHGRPESWFLEWDEDAQNLSLAANS